MMAAAGAGAQVEEYSIDAASNSIVRTIDDSCVLIYAEESPTMSRFVLRNELTGQALAFPFVFGRVHDMQIYDGKWVYFCGEDLSNLGMVGMFDIRGVFYSGGAVLWQSVSPSMYDYDILVESLDRLDLFTDSGRVCMAMVGRALFAPTSMHKEKNILFSASLNGIQWKFYCDATKPDSINFTDIACLDDVIVAVGDDSTGAGCYLKTYYRHLNFLSNACTPGRGFKILFQNPEGKVIVTKYAGNTASVAHYDATRATVLHRVTFSSGGSIPSGIAENWMTATPSYSTGGGMQEMVTASDGTTYLLQSTDYPASGNPNVMPWLVRFNYNIAPTSTVQAAACYYKNCSLDVTYSGLHPRTSGHSPWLTVDHPIMNMTTPQCKLPMALPMQFSITSIIKPIVYEGFWEWGKTTSTTGPIVEVVNTHVICN